MDKLKYRMREKWMDKLKYRMREREREIVCCFNAQIPKYLQQSGLSQTEVRDLGPPQSPKVAAGIQILRNYMLPYRMYWQKAKSEVV